MTTQSNQLVNWSNSQSVSIQLNKSVGLGRCSIIQTELTAAVTSLVININPSSSQVKLFIHVSGYKWHNQGHATDIRRRS